MNSRQKAALWAGVVLFTVIGLFPPWAFKEISTGFAFIGSPPKYHHIDFQRLIVLWAIACALTGAAVTSLASGTAPHGEPHAWFRIRKALLLTGVGVGILVGGLFVRSRLSSEVGVKDGSTSESAGAQTEREDIFDVVAREKTTITVNASELESPAAESRAHTRLESGTQISPGSGASGLGKLTIRNGTGLDSVVKLVEKATGTARRYVYVRAGEETALQRIAPGLCVVRFALGDNWDQKKKKFLAQTSYAEFLEPLRFEERPSEDRVGYVTFTLTLHPVAGGTAKTKDIGEADF